tara:strand:+ start:4209 stop:5009 length:801 start_codon:yes stop_codon:yes gene_type:complete
MMIDNELGFIIPNWPAPKNVQALVSTRVSLNKTTSPTNTPKGYEHFNLALHVNDDPKQVLTNRAQLARHLKIPLSNIAWLDQVHGTEVVSAEKCTNATIKADASTSTTAQHACAIMTADCLPVLFCNIPEAGEPQQVAAAHAGWRSLADGILSKTLDTFDRPETVIAWLGPAISQIHFEVGQEVFEAFIIKNVANKKAFISNQNSSTECPKWLASLTELAKIELTEAGIKAVYDSKLCTYAQSELFYSYRRDGAQSGRMVSLIMIS